ncbi:PKD domain-containing protein [Niastella caeni]|uniref:PKD domain-containing protein n=1 Tax=Niastella caeni TaxID=2569763 RepID=A0A4V4H1W0_9BACT|nr:PKD domain-containing protein [Niastella caeni]
MAVALCITGVTQLAAQGPSTFEFVENKGQWDNQVRFKGDLPTGNFYLHKNGFTVVQHNTTDLKQVYDNHSESLNNLKGQLTGKGIQAKNNTTPRRLDSTYTLRSHAYKVQFIGAAANPEMVPDKVMPGISNYLIGKDPSKWRSKVISCQAILYKNIYPNIDVRYYSESGRLKYDIIVNPGGDVNNIVMQYDGADKLSIKNRELVIKTSVGEVRELYPYTYQFDNVHGKQETSCSYKLEGKNTVRFKTGAYSKTSTLVIDPSIVFSSFTGSTANEFGFTATPGPDGSLFSGSIVYGAGFPTSPGAYKTTFTLGGARGCDIGIFKFSPNGANRIYATYIGGSADDYPHSLYSDAQGNLVVLGRTYSTDYPGTLVGSGGGCDMVVTKLNAAGSALIGSLRLGGPGNDGVNIEDQMESNDHKTNSLLTHYGDDSHSEVILDDAGYIYVAGQTQSDFPMIGNGFEKNRKGSQDGVVLKIAPDCNSVIWSTFLGGAGDDAAFVLALRPNTNEIYVAGATSSSDFPGTVAGFRNGVINDTLVGGIDGYVSIISNDGTTLQRSTYLGTQQEDLIFGIQFDRNYFPYVLGSTRGTWPVINAAYSNAGSRQFITKLRPDLTGIEYSTIFGNGAKPNISPVAFLVDRCENVYVSGWGGWMTPDNDPYDMGGVRNMPVTPDALKTVTDDRDFYFIVLERNAASLLYGSYFGQDGGLGEHVDGGTSRFDAQGAIYQAICANCYGSPANLPITRNYPTTPGAWSSVNGTGNNGCNLGAVKILFNFSGVGSGPKAYFNGMFDTVGCVPFELTFRDTVLDARSYEWNFGDGSPEVNTTNFNVTHTYNRVGIFQVRLIAVDSSTCNIRDTAYLNIHVRDDKANLAFDVTKLLPCESLNYEFENTTTFPPGKPFKASSFTWDFGDGTRITPGNLTAQHSYASPGTYIAKLILHDTAYCNSPDSISQELRVSPLVDARFETPPQGCAPYTAVFNNTSLAGQQFFWNFGDGTTSTEVNPTHEYVNVNTYHVTLVVIDSNTCNIIDSTSMDITVYPLPIADFSVSPVPPNVNQPAIFTNLSTGAIEYRWFFGDGDSVIKKTADTVHHQYNATGTFEACLVAYSENGCSDTACKPVQALINPLLDVPNAFTPGRFGRNSFVTVAGFGIAKMNWKIYNRWGKLVFETQDRRIGWDGTYKGQPQPMDVYAYTLDVEFFDGKTLRKTGDITLIR